MEKTWEKQVIAAFGLYEEARYTVGPLDLEMGVTWAE